MMCSQLCYQPQTQIGVWNVFGSLRGQANFPVDSASHLQTILPSVMVLRTIVQQMSHLPIYQMGPTSIVL